MKRIRFFTLALLVANSGAAVGIGADNWSLAYREVRVAQNDEAAPGDAVLTAPALAETPPAQPSPSPAVFPTPALPYGPILAHGHCGMGQPACCEREYSPFDGIWDSYCADKARFQAPFTPTGLFHIKSRHACEPCALPHACVPACDGTFGLPKLSFPKRSFETHATKACAPCGKCAHGRRASFGGLKNAPCADCAAEHLSPPLHEQAAPASVEPSPMPESLPLDDALEGELPDASESAPSAEPMPELPAADQADRGGRGWLSLPRLKLLPL